MSLREVLGDVFTIGKIAPEHDHLLGNVRWKRMDFGPDLGGELPRSLEIMKEIFIIYNDKDLDWACQSGARVLSICCVFEAKTCNLLHFGARIFHAHFLIKIFYSYHRFLHVH